MDSPKMVLLVLSLFALQGCGTGSRQIPNGTAASANESAASADTAKSAITGTLQDNPFNVTSTATKIRELGLPTVSKVAQLEERARTAFDSVDCKAAVPALEQFAKQANWLANLISDGLQPFYGASYEDQQKLPYARVQVLVPIEAAANLYKTKRNRAMVMEAECLVRLGDQDAAVGLLVNALGLLPADQYKWWTRARLDLYRLIEVTDSTGHLRVTSK